MYFRFFSSNKIIVFLIFSDVENVILHLMLILPLELQQQLFSMLLDSSMASFPRQSHS